MSEARRFIVEIPSGQGLDTADEIARKLIYASGLYGGVIGVRPEDGGDDSWARPETWERPR